MCECITQVNDAIEEKNATLTLVMFPDKESRVLITTKNTDPNGINYIPNIYAPYCPFCGVKYDE